MAMSKMQQRSTGLSCCFLRLALLVLLSYGIEGHRTGARNHWQHLRIGKLPAGEHDGMDPVDLARLKPLSEWQEWREQHEEKEMRSVRITPVRPSAESQGKNLTEQAKDTFDRMRQFHNARNEYHRQLLEFHLKYFHGWTIRRDILMDALVWWVATAIWHSLYFQHFYINDRQVQPELLPQEVLEKSSGTRPDVPDIVLIFHHPDSPVPEYDCLGREKPRSSNLFIRTTTLDSMRVVSRKEGFFDTFRATNPPSARTSSSMSLAEMRRAGIAPIGALMDRIAGRGEQTLAVARSTLLQEFYAALPVWGFDASICRSICGTKLFVCIHLRRKEAIDYHLVQSEWRLQIQSSVVQQLGIDQPQDSESSSPPFVRYDARRAERLYNAKTIPSTDPHELYRTFLLPAGGKSIITGIHRTTFIVKEITDRLNLDAACQANLMLGWYPVHQPHELDVLKDNWVTSSNLWKVTFEQPLTAIESYFGSRIAFNFGWTGHYCKALLALVPVALCFQMFFSTVTEQNTKKILGFSLALTTWSRLTDNLWNKEETYFKALWDVESDTNLIRPQFRGALGPSPLDGNLAERIYPEYLARRWQLFSSAVTAAFCFGVMSAIYTWDMMFQEEKNVISSIVLAIQIKIYEKIYSFLVVHLLEWENHKYELNHFNSLLWKQFLFQSVNNYSAFGYLIVRCPNKDCLYVVQKQIVLTMALLSFMRLADVAFEGIKVRWRIWREDQQIENPGSEPKTRCFTEEQEKYEPHDVSEQIDSVLQLIIALGYVLIFGPAAPLCVPFCFVVFLVQLWSYAFLLTHYKRRPFPNKAVGMGRWKSAVHMLMRASIFTSGYLVTSFGTSFERAPRLARVSGFVIFCLVQILLGWLIDVIIPADRCEASFLLLARRSYVQRALLREGSLPSPAATSSASAAVASSAEAVREGTWSEIPDFKHCIDSAEPKY